MQNWREVYEHYKEAHKKERTCPYREDDAIKCPGTGHHRNLEQHMRRHFDVRPVKCPEHDCDDVYFHESDLDRHRRRMHGYRPEPKSRGAASSAGSSAGGITPALSDASTFPDSSAPSTPAAFSDESDEPSPSSTHAPDTTPASGVRRDATVGPSSTPRAPTLAPFTHGLMAAPMYAVKPPSALPDASEVAHGAWLEALHLPDTPAAALAMLHAQAPVQPGPAVPRLPPQSMRTRRTISTQDTRFAPYDVRIAQNPRARQARMPAAAVAPCPPTVPSTVQMPVPTHWTTDFRQAHVDDPYIGLRPAFGRADAGYGAYDGFGGDARFWPGVVRGAAGTDVPAPYAPAPRDPEGPTMPEPMPYIPSGSAASGSGSVGNTMWSSSTLRGVLPAQQLAYHALQTDPYAVQEPPAGFRGPSAPWSPDQTMGSGGVPQRQLGIEAQPHHAAALHEPDQEFRAYVAQLFPESLWFSPWAGV